MCVYLLAFTYEAHGATTLQIRMMIFAVAHLLHVCMWQMRGAEKSQGMRLACLHADSSHDINVTSPIRKSQVVSRLVS